MADIGELPEDWRTKVALLLGNVEDIPQIVSKLRTKQTDLHGEALLVSRTIIRLALAYLGYVQPSNSQAVQVGPADVVALLRQVIRMIGGPCSIPAPLWQQLRQYAEAARLIGEPGVGPKHEILVMAQPWHAEWLEHSELVDELALRNQGDDYVADGMLFGMSTDSGTSWTTYRSAAQKAAVDCWLFAPPSSTTLVTLPTGSGKSICTLLPAWFGSRGGRRSRELTLVIVPTVALAIDQVAQAERYFSHARGDHAKPLAWIGDTSAQERHDIQAAIRDGRLPVIFTSPESLVGSQLYYIILDAARRGLITRFVIDEAHLIESWGIGFRPEFQMLASFRRQLLEASGNRLRTLLLSATITQRSRDTLEMLFADPHPLIEIRANRLRPEPAYWFAITPRENIRIERVMEALRFLPRPLILYVTQPKEAKRWAQRLREAGYARLAVFSGTTLRDERRRILQQWSNNEIDIVIGTSAFGLGVDKEDVRSVVHATIPENMDRFYQEVGRSGRDGYSAVSLVCATDNHWEKDDDVSKAFSLLLKLITLTKALPRWEAMLAGSRNDGDVYWVDRDARPTGRDDMMAGERNRDWNDHLLLLMQRAQLIEIADVPPPLRDDSGGVTNKFPIRILEPAIFNEPEAALSAIEPQREHESEQAKAAIQQIVELVRDQSKYRRKECLAGTFAAMYADAQMACGGCPDCRATDTHPYAKPLAFDVEYPTRYRRMPVLNDGEELLDPTLDSLLGASRTLNLTWRGERSLTSMAPVIELLPTLVHAGFVQVIFPDQMFDDVALRKRVIPALGTPNPHQAVRYHRLLPVSWITEKDYPLLPLASIVIYPPEDSAAYALYKVMEHQRQRLQRIPDFSDPGQINIVHEQLHLDAAGKAFHDQVDGLRNTWEWLQSRLTLAHTEEDFF